MPTEGDKPKSGVVKSARRREELRRTLPKPAIDIKGLFLRREYVNTMLIFLVFCFAAGALVLYSHAQLRLEPGQVMTETRLKRIDFLKVNRDETKRRRSEAKESAPHVYRLNEPYLSKLRGALLNLPDAVKGLSDVSEVNEELRVAFDLTQARLEIVQQFVNEGEVSEQWKQWVDDLIQRGLPESPTITNEQFQQEKVRALPEFRANGRTLRTSEFTKFDPEDEPGNRDRLETLASRFNIPGEVAPMIVARLAHAPEPVYFFDDEATRARALEAEESVPDVTVPHRAGEPIYRRGDTLKPEQIDIVQLEKREHDGQATAAERTLDIVGAYGIVALITLFIAGYLIRFYPRVVRNAWRVIAIAALCLVMLLCTVTVSARVPVAVYPAAMATTVFLGIILVIAYDQRLATMVTALVCALTAFALDQSVGFFVMTAAVCGAGIASLRQVRHRNALIRAALIAGVVGTAAALILGVVEVPLHRNGDPIRGAWTQIVVNAGLSFAGCMFAGFVLLGILPSIEKLFNMTTGMTLVELRDPRIPLLRQLQERAPGTYNHSIAVANIAEAAADAIGADALLTYVGALYHDIGKMNKPDYFVENQEDGANKHNKLSPAMSLLVIVGHVKDGVELAREYNLPKPMRHFIASHHGTTLVEYFFFAAKAKAEADGEGEKVHEIEFRYPGPKPRTKEAAILMVADASESAARAMQDPGPASLENLVRKLSRQRLDDGQFNECDLTLRELTLIEDAVVKGLRSLYHQRVAYPDKGEEPQSQPHPQPNSKDELPHEAPVARPTSA